MLRSGLSRVMWVGRATVFLIGLALMLALLANPAQGQAETTTTTDRTTFSEAFIDQCTGEVFHIDGTILTVGHSTIDANGGQHFQYHVDTRGTGESLTTGAEYAFHNVTQGQANYLGGSQTYYTSYVTTMRRQGSTTPDDDFKITISLKQTINANGELTTQIVKDELSCK